MPPPVPRYSGWGSSSLISPDRISLPRYGGRVGLHIDLFGACSAFTRVAACTLAQSPIVTANRRLQPLRYLHDCSDCFRLERIAGWGLHPLESAAFARRTPFPAVRGAAMKSPGSTLRGHSMISSARERIDGGMVSPSVLAVLRLITSSNVVDWWAGRRGGLEAARIS